MIMKTLKSKVAALALTTGVGIAVFATSVDAAAGPNDGGRNCHGVWLSYQSTSGMSPGQLHKEFGASVQHVQATADIVCGS
jgi:hypothetical protein